ncbi:uncharacterized protein B0I36DRAFT_376460 [Microdochium trichocladiopsis]|uniref:Uncharacterized protein n=1 Tax=Microdochium trichocladiopsis TaxID=1682393 RepID=A0A9P9BL31_9PEZI|nr:uncharacterized protein B0I36DRAFT_376460 [Microdochium trichocladiopsis]KAH7024474.1 hypothetical protein B0I36DRAFT_376460 [Microdochium trichocladiopsis]
MIGRRRLEADSKAWRTRSRASVSRRFHIIGFSALALSIILCLIAVPYRDNYINATTPHTQLGSIRHDDGGNGSTRSHPSFKDVKLHIVIPASHQDVNLCKLVLGCSLLDYPNPTIVAWRDTYKQAWILGGGSHLAKVFRVLEYLQALDPSQDDELVLMLDAYDVHLQLPRSTLISRYYELRDAAQKRLVESVGKTAVQDGGLSQRIIFGAGKRCAPNEPHTVACYAVPDSPMPQIYGPNTDTAIGHNHHYSVRQRYLNSGYVLGPAKAMREMYEEAWKFIQAQPDMDPDDDGSHTSDYVYHGSDQSVFAAMYGRQEFAREKIRLQYAPVGTRPRSSTVFFTPIDNVLNPSFHHEEFDVDLDSGDNPYEHGIFLDFASDLGHQTINSELDAAWIQYRDRDDEKAMSAQIGQRLADFDCPANLPEALPHDIADARIPTDGDIAAWPSPWLSRPLYTHLCMSRMPVLRHMNGDKSHREKHWDRMWYVPRARELFKALQESMARNATLKPKTELKHHMANPALEVAGAVWTKPDGLLRWEDLCPAEEYDKEIFRKG